MSYDLRVAVKVEGCDYKLDKDPSKDRLFLIFSGIALVSNSLTRIIERFGDSDDKE